MPHARSGRPRAARPLQANRADLTQPSAQAVPDQPYGVAAEQRSAMNAIPLPVPQQAQPAPGGAVPSQPTSGAPPLAIPGANGPLSRPTERPNEPVTHGLPMGPGPGPEALTGIGAAARQGAVEQGTLSHLLTSLAAQPNSTSAIKDLAARANSGAM